MLSELTGEIKDFKAEFRGEFKDFKDELAGGFIRLEEKIDTGIRHLLWVSFGTVCCLVNP
jgi:hypothetical protein